MRKPTPTDFGIDIVELDKIYSEIQNLEYLSDEKSYQLIEDDSFNLIGTIIFAVLGWIVLALTLNEVAFGFNICLAIPAFYVGWIWVTFVSNPIKLRFSLSRRIDAQLNLEELRKSLILIQYKEYKAKFSEYREFVNQREQEWQQAKRNYDGWIHQFNKSKREFWLSLDGLTFEKELKNLYCALGYKASLTAKSGDYGVDIDLRKDGKYIIVQCKAHAKPVGSPDVMKLLGSLHHFRADEAVLASTNGFTRSAMRVAKGQPIKLIQTENILEMQISLQKDFPKQPPPPPPKYNYSDLQEYVPETIKEKPLKLNDTVANHQAYDTFLLSQEKPRIKLNDVLSTNQLIISYGVPIVGGLLIVFSGATIVKNYMSINSKTNITTLGNENLSTNSKPANISKNTNNKKTNFNSTNKNLENLRVGAEQNSKNLNVLEVANEKTSLEMVVNADTNSSPRVNTFVDTLVSGYKSNRFNCLEIGTSEFCNWHSLSS